MQIWNHPPNWPAPPEGWVPVPGWQPDPSWPAAPDGWDFWTDPPDRLPTLPVSSAGELQQITPPLVPSPVAHIGFLASWKAKREARDAAKAKAKAEAAAVAAEQARQAKMASLLRQIEFVAGWPDNAPHATGLVLRKAEHAVAELDAAGLVEVKRQQGHYMAGSSGVSIRVAKGVRVRAGAVRGHYVPGDEAETQIDAGSAVITNQRVVFSGSRQSREWKFDNLLGHHLVANKRMAWIELPVTNRQKMSALSFARDQADAVAGALQLALLFHADEQQAFLADLRHQLGEATQGQHGLLP